MGLTVDFKCSKDDNRGIYYSETSRAIVYLAMHETLEDVIKTINHEVYHHCLEENGESDKMDEEQEEKAIFFLQWADVSI